MIFENAYSSSRVNTQERGDPAKRYIVMDCFFLPRLGLQFLTMTADQGS
jgi:hypothetical protein